MKNIAIVLALASMGAQAASLSGTVSDAHCATKHNDGSTESMACVKKCVDGGSEPVIISGNKVYKISNPESVKNHLGHKVRVIGDVDGETVTIQKLTMPK